VNTPGTEGEIEKADSTEAVFMGRENVTETAVVFGTPWAEPAGSVATISGD